MINSETSPPMNPVNRPKLSPQSLNGVEPSSYFVPPTPGAGRGKTGMNQWPGDARSSTAGGQDENSGGFFGTGSGNSFNFAGSSSESKSSPANGKEGEQEAKEEHPWGSAAPSSFALSPSSNAFNHKFNRLGGFAAAHDIPPTPLYPPAHSPFIPTSSQPQSNPFDFPSSSSTPQSNSGSISSFQLPSTTSSSTSGFNFALPSPGARKLAPRPSIRSSNPPNASASSNSASSNRFAPVLPTTLFSLLQTSLSADSSNIPLLVLDIRTHTAYLSERLSTSINVCVPSTLLRRPGFGVDRVQDGLPEHEQDQFAAWNSCETIVAIDAESTSLSEGQSGVASLLAKFERAGFKGKLHWIKGGWYAIKTQARGFSGSEQAKLFQSGSGSPKVSSSAQPSPDLASGSNPTSDSNQFNLNQPPPGSKKHGRPVLQVRNLPTAAFQLASTSAFVHSGMPTATNGISVTSPSSDGSSSSRRPNLGKRRKSSNEPATAQGERVGLTLGSQDALPSPIGESPDTPKLSASNAGRNVRGAAKMSSNPFFDNIRQNSEALSLDRSLANLNPVELPEMPSDLVPTLPQFLQDLLALEPMQRADKLARQFYELEVAERERLEGTFRWHAKHTAVESAPHTRVGRNGQGLDDGEESPETQQWKKFGISAGVELGGLNRFKNIFPYEYRRVRLTDHSPHATDYINASHLRLPPSSKRFVASQGPLPATYSDFWQLCAQEQVGVIIMLTNLNEGGREKCGRYWITPQGGQTDWDVRVVGDKAHEDEQEQWKREEKTGGNLLFGGGGSSGGFFAPADAELGASKSQESKPTTRADQTVRRMFTVQRLGGRGFDPATTNTRPRKIRHIQYRAWPDFDIPADPSELVALIEEVDRAQAEYMQEIGWKLEDHDGMEPPILAHCSAGVGRTGVYIMVSSMLDMLRRARSESVASGETKPQDDVAPMEVDTTPPQSGAVSPARPELITRSSDPETSSLSAHFSLSSLDSARASPVPSHSAASSERPTPQTLSARSSTTSLRRPEPESISGPHPVLPPSDDPTPVLLQDDPVFAGVNALREQRMSMVANYRQYVCVIECVLEGIKREAARTNETS
ncbi:uncharacterized protein JCM6883_006789 [Sporobolomyces salmoneus]|uniref:uncharacterized protein n=1 Tax=Sporobolomyces salmoneus TaxID=183962 RepID=UPI00316BDEB8